MRYWHFVYLGLSLLCAITGRAAAEANATAGAVSSATVPSASASGVSPKAAEDKPPAVTREKGAPAKPEPSHTATSETVNVDGSTYLVRLRDLEQRVDELKEQIRRSHTRLSLLSDSILAGGVGGARAEITFVNDMSNVFQLTRALFLLDGAVQNNKQDESGVLAEQKEIPVFSGSIPPGDHTLQVLVQLRGHGFGVFSYLQGYRFEIRSSHSFTVTEGKTVELKAIAYEKGGVTVPLEQRPAMRYFEKVRTTSQGDPSAQAAGSQPNPKAGSGK